MPLVTQIFNLLQSPIDVNDQQVTRICFADNSSALLKGSLFKIIKHFIKELTFNHISNSTMKKHLIDVNWDLFEVTIINQERIEHKCVASLINAFENVFNGWDKPAHKPGQIKRWCGGSEGGKDGKRKMFMALSVYDWLIGNLPCFYQRGGLYSMIEGGLESSIVNEVC